MLGSLPREALRASTVFLPDSLPDPSPTTSDSRAPGAISLHTGIADFCRHVLGVFKLPGIAKLP